MVYATFSEDMLEILKNLESAIFLSYDCATTFGMPYGNLRINTDKMSVEITNIQKELPFYDATEDIACFACEISDPDKEFKPYCDEPYGNFKIGEKIVEMKIINDVIDVNDGEYIISFDRAVVIKTEKRTIMFSRSIWFAEDIAISDNDDYDSVFSINDVIDAWSNEGADKVTVKRSIKDLWDLGDAIRHEIKTKTYVGGKSHVQKGKERLRNLEKILQKENLSKQDKSIVEGLIKDLKQALEGK